MAKKLLENAAAEKEANDIGMRYMNSSDVLGDMKRDYGSALDGVRVHDDAAANARVAAARRDGLASGKDIYMRSGSLSSSAPEVKGLLAHEVAHTMQQSGGAEASHSVEYGSEQGGFFDSFKKRFGKKKKDETDPLEEWASSMSDEEIANLTTSAPQLKAVRKHTPSSSSTGKEFLTQNGSADLSGITDSAQREDELRYQTFLQSDEVPRELASDPKIQSRAISDYQGFVQGQLAKYLTPKAQAGEITPEDEQDAFVNTIRINSPKLKGMSQLLRASLPEKFTDALYSLGEVGMQSIDAYHFDDDAQGTRLSIEGDIKGERHTVEDYMYGTNGVEADPEVLKMVALRDQAYSYIQSQVDKEGSDTQRYMLEAAKAYSFGGKQIGSDDDISASLMNTLVLRSIAPDISSKAQKAMESATAAKAGALEGSEEWKAASEGERKAKGVGEYAKWLQFGVKNKQGADLSKRSSYRFLSAMKKHFKKK